MFKKKPKVLTPEQAEEIRTKDFFDMILPGTVKFLSDHYIVGDSYRCVWAIREYPPSTEEQAILSQLADRNGVTLRIYHRLVEFMEQRKIIQNATRRNRLKSGGNDVSETIEAEGNLQDVIELLANLRKNKEPLLHVSVFIELKAKSMEKLKELQSDIAMELTRSKISVDRNKYYPCANWKSILYRRAISGQLPDPYGCHHQSKTKRIKRSVPEECNNDLYNGTWC